MDVDVAIVGAGGAGLSLVLALADLPRPPRIALVDPVRRQGADRTWCYWDGGAGGDPVLDPILHRSWTQLELVDAAGRARILDLAPMRYVMLRSQDFYAAADAAARRLDLVRIEAAADEVRDGDRHAVVRAGGTELRARWVFDSRPARPRRPGSTAMLQHFRGWTVRFDADAVRPDLATLMDFSTPQPARGVSFAYCLPLDARRALVEYTEFSARRLPGEKYDAALSGYLRRRWPALAGGAAVEAVEDGAIPMTDAAFDRRAGHRVFRLGTAGGATRGSTGYTFAAMRRQAAAVADRLAAGQVPVPPRPYPRRHVWMDAVLLRALDRGIVRGPDLFTSLFDRNPPGVVLRFLDGATSVAEELAVMRTTPMAAMGRAAAGDAAARVARRMTRIAAAVPGRRDRPGS